MKSIGNGKRMAVDFKKASYWQCLEDAFFYPFEWAGPNFTGQEADGTKIGKQSHQSMLWFALCVANHG